MVLLLALPVVAATASLHRFLRRCGPTNLVVARALSGRPTLSEAANLGALAVLLVTLGRGVGLAVASGAPEWLNLVVLILLWDSVKLLVASLRILRTQHQRRSLI